MATLVVNAKYVGGVDPEELKRKIYWELNWYHNTVQIEVDDIEIKSLNSDDLIQDYMVETFGNHSLGHMVRFALSKLGVEISKDVSMNKNFL